MGQAATGTEGADTIVIPQKGVYRKTSIPRWNVKGLGVEIGLPILVVRKLAEDANTTPDEFLQTHLGVWRFDSFPGLHLNFIPRKRRRKRRRTLKARDTGIEHQESNIREVS